MSPHFPIPKTLYIELTTECNLRCKQCHMWLTRKGPQALGTEDKRELIEQFAELNPGGAVVFTGGETFKDPDELFTLSLACRERGIQTLTNTNGTYLCGENVAKMIVCGPDVVVISLDSHTQAVHDLIRGVRGTFLSLLQGIDRILNFRSEAGGGPPTVYVSGILCDLTLDGAINLVEFVRGLGVDGISFQMLAPTFKLVGKADRFFQRHWFRDTDAAKTVLRGLAERYSGDDFVLLSREDFYWMSVYLDSPAVLREPICASHERNVWVDMNGEIQLCAFMSDVTGGRTLGNVRDGPLVDLLRSEFAMQARGIMESCTRPCGMLNCHRRMNGARGGDSV